MKIKAFGCLVVLMLATAWMASAAETLNNGSIVELQSLNMGDGVIIEKIKTSQCDFDTSITGLKALKAAGVSGPVIQAMMAKSSSSPAPAPAGDVNDPASAHTPGVWILQTVNGVKTMTQLEPEYPAEITHGGFIGPFGAGKFSTTARITGMASSLQLTTAKPEFYLYTGSPGMGEFPVESPAEIALAQFKVLPKDAKKNADERAIDIATAGAYSSSQGLDRKYVRQYDPTRIADGIFKLVPHADLADGEYAFCPTYAANIYAGVRERFYKLGVKTGSAEPAAGK